MTRLLLPILTGALSLITTMLAGQTPCGTEELAGRNLLRFPELAAQRQEAREVIEKNLSRTNDFATLRTVVTIPVVVHVVYKGGFENISDAQIQSQLDVLNTDYRLLNPNAADVPAEFQPFAADVEFEFCLAAQDPAGLPTTGVTRTPTTWFNIGQLSAPDGSPRVCYTALGGEDSWDPEHYLNIWVASIGGGILGYATLPGTAPPAEDGVVIDPHNFGTIGLAAPNVPHHLGRTATHEIGHYFDLRHIWGGNENVCTDDDDVADTPVQRAAYLGCPLYPQYSCGNSAMFMNYMDYPDDACLALFTLGQKARMWAALTGARPGLLDSPGCTASPVREPAAATLRLFPNPVEGILTVETGQDLEARATVTAVDVLGREWNLNGNLLSANTLTVDLGQLPSGFYVLKIGLKNGRMFTATFAKD